MTAAIAPVFITMKQQEERMRPSETAESIDNYLNARRNARSKLKPTAHKGKPPEIEKDVPLPVRGRGGANNHSHFYRFEDMEVGDSFWIDGDSKCTVGAITKFAQRTGWKFTTRAQSKDGRKNTQVAKTLRGLRVWRLS